MPGNAAHGIGIARAAPNVMGRFGSIARQDGDRE
jgi:hypothetical protein